MGDTSPTQWNDNKLGASGPIAKWVTPTPHDTTLLTNGPCRAITVKDDTGGNLVSILQVDGTTAILYIAKGQVHPSIATRINATGTNATTVMVGY